MNGKHLQTTLKSLPDDTLANVFSFLNQVERNETVHSSSIFYNPLKAERLVLPLLRYISMGNQEMVVKIVTKYPRIVVIKEPSVTDRAGRTFFNISAVELLRYYWDIQSMGNAILDVLNMMQDRYEAASIKRKWIELYENYEENDGILICHNGEYSTCKAYDPSTLLSLLQHCANQFSNLRHSERKDLFCSIGYLQSLLPPVILQHYCNPKIPFFPIPSFLEPMNRIVQLSNFATRGKGENLNVLDLKIFNILKDRKAAIVRGGGNSAKLMTNANPETITADFNAIMQLQAQTDGHLIQFQNRLQKGWVDLQIRGKCELYQKKELKFF